MTSRLGRSLVPLLAAASLAGGCASDKSVISKANSANDQLEPTIIDDPQIEAYMAKLGKRIVTVAASLSEEGFGPKSHTKGEDNEWMFKDVQWHMVGSPTLNAFTTGGHHVYIYSELFKTAKTEDEFAAVCSHEFAHIYCRHVQAGMDRQYGVYGVAALAAVGGAAIGGKDNALTGAATGGAAGLAAGQFLGMGFTRKDEDEADKYGFQFYTRAGWDPNHFADFFQQMIDKGYDKTPEIASDHPKLASRVENTKRRTAELEKDNPNWKTWQKPDTASPSEFTALQSRATKLAKQIPQTKEAQAAELMLAAFPSCVAPTASQDQQAARDRLSSAANDGKTSKRRK